MLKAFVGKYKFPLLLILVILIGIWPLSFYVFIPKWDNIDCYLPYKYFWSSAVWNGHWPFWNPFEYFGLPAYSDMQNGLFNPITWLIVLLMGEYDTFSLATEITIYHLIAGLGMYRFMGLFLRESWIRFATGATYALSGFMLGTSQIGIFIMGAAWLPWFISEVILLHKNKNWKNAFCLGILISLQLTSASPAYSVILLYLLAGYAFYHIIFKKFPIIQSIQYYSVAGVIVVCTALPFFLGFLDFIPYFSRLEKLPYIPWIYEGSFDFVEYISFLFPYLTVHDSEVFGTSGISLRNGYFGLLGVAGVLFAFIHFKKYTNLKLKLAGLAILFLILAAGDHTPFYRWFYELPGFGNFRHPSFFRSHALFFLITIMGIGLRDARSNPKTFKIIIAGLCFIGVLGFVWGIFKSNPADLNLLLSDVFAFTEQPVNTIFTFWVIAGLAIILPTAAYLLLQKRQNFTAPILITLLLDLLIHAHLVLPNTVITPTIRQNRMTEFFNSLPTELSQKPGNNPLNTLNHAELDFSGTGIWRNQSTFAKKITPAGHNATQFKNFNTIEENGVLEKTIQNPLFYLANKNSREFDTIENSKFCFGENCPDKLAQDTDITSYTIDYNRFEINLDNPSDSGAILVVNQNYHHNWFVEYTTQKTKPLLVNDALIGIEIPPHYKGPVKLKFKAPYIKSAIKFALLSWFVLLVIGIVYVFPTHGSKDVSVPED